MNRSAKLLAFIMLALSLLATTGCNKLKARDQLNKGVQAYKNAKFEEAIEKFDRALEAWGGRYESEVYDGAHHGWTVPDHQGAYNEPQAERAFAKLKGLLAETLQA